MGKIEKFLYPILQAICIIGGGVYTAYGLVSTFIDLPNFIKDWRWGLALGFTSFVFGIGLKFRDIYVKYVWWAEPEIKITPKVVDKYLDNNFYKSALLNIYNKEEIEITECFATLEFVDDVSFSSGKIIKSIPIIPSLSKIPDRIKWLEATDMSSSCEITIPPNKDKNIDLADILHTLRYHLRNGDINANWMIGSPLHTVKIRIDGHFNSKAMKPSFFEGYICAWNFTELTETYIKDGKIKRRDQIIADQISGLKMIFRMGDWKKDKEVIEYLESLQKIVKENN